MSERVSKRVEKGERYGYQEARRDMRSVGLERDVSSLQSRRGGY